MEPVEVISRAGYESSANVSTTMAASLIEYLNPASGHSRHSCYRPAGVQGGVVVDDRAILRRRRHRSAVTGRVEPTMPLVSATSSAPPGQQLAIAGRRTRITWNLRDAFAHRLDVGQLVPFAFAFLRAFAMSSRHLASGAAATTITVSGPRNALELEPLEESVCRPNAFFPDAVTREKSRSHVRQGAARQPRSPTAKGRSCLSDDQGFLAPCP